LDLCECRDRQSKVRADSVTLLPRDPDESAEQLRVRLTADAGGLPIGVIVTDTFGRPWRDGLVDIALGVAGIGAILDYRGNTDMGGRELHHTMLALGDEIAAAAGLLMEKGAGVAAVVVRGVPWGRTGGRGRDLIRPAALDLFR
jgi:coenzyme F420-0:L-glutamate ligase/coenzyme F420-1:gamma-L-glutamate ligase